MHVLQFEVSNFYLAEDNQSMRLRDNTFTNMDLYKSRTECIQILYECCPEHIVQIILYLDREDTDVPVGTAMVLDARCSV